MVAIGHKCEWMKIAVENSRLWPHTMFQVLRSHTQRTFPSVQDVVSPHATLKPMQTDPHGDPESTPTLTKGQPRCAHRTGQTESVSCLGWDFTGMLKAPGQLCRWEAFWVGFSFNNAYVFHFKIMLLTCMLLTENSCNAEK